MQTIWQYLIIWFLTFSFLTLGFILVQTLICSNFKQNLAFQCFKFYFLLNNIDKNDLKQYVMKCNAIKKASKKWKMNERNDSNKMHE